MPLTWTRTPADDASEPVSLADAKAHLRVDGADEDSVITALIEAAREQCEEYLRRTILDSIIQLRLDYFHAERFCLPRGPVRSIESVSYLDTDGVNTALDQSTYTLLTGRELDEITLGYGKTWPATLTQPGAVTIDYAAGMALNDGTGAPAPVVHAIKLLVGHLFENREAVIVGTSTSELPMGVKSLLNPFRVYEVA